MFKGLPEGWVSQGASLLLVVMDEAGLWLRSQVKVTQLRVNRKTLLLLLNATQICREMVRTDGASAARLAGGGTGMCQQHPCVCPGIVAGVRRVG